MLFFSNGGTQDIAQRRAGIGGTEFLHRLLLFLGFAGLDRQRQPAAGFINLSDFRVDLLTGGKPIRALLGTIPAELGLANETRHRIVDPDLNAVIDNRRNRARDHVTLLDLADGTADGVFAELLDTK